MTNVNYRIKSKNIDYVESDFFKVKDYLKYKGSRFNSLLILDFPGYFVNRNDKKKHAAILAKCDCGKEVTTRFERVKNGYVKSCGCIHKLYHPKGSFGQSLRGLFTRYVSRARTTKKEFTLNQDEFTKIITSNCFYCGVEPLMKHTFKGCPEHVLHNGIDRYDNAKGYTLENSRPCCFECNRAKGTLTPEEFYNYINRLIRYASSIKNSAKTVNPKSTDMEIPC